MDHLTIIKENKQDIENKSFPLEFITRPIIENKPGIYVIFNTKNFRCYIGKSSLIKNRLKGHFYQLSNGKHNNPLLQKDYFLYGIKTFFVIALQYLESFTFIDEYDKKNLTQSDRERLNNLEEYYITDFVINKGYQLYNKDHFIKRLIEEDKIEKKINFVVETIYPKDSFLYNDY